MTCDKIWNVTKFGLTIKLSLNWSLKLWLPNSIKFVLGKWWITHTFDTLYILNKWHVTKFGILQNLVLQIKLNLSIKVKKIIKNNILLLLNFLNEKDKSLESRKQILWIKQLNIKEF